MIGSTKRVVAITTLAVTLILIATAIANPYLLKRSVEPREKEILCYNRVGNIALDSYGKNFIFTNDTISFSSQTDKEITVVGLDCIIKTKSQ